MKTIQYSSKESSYKLINGIGVTVLTLGIIISALGFVIGFGDTNVQFIAYSIGVFFSSLFCYAICRGISELVFRAYLKGKLDEFNMQENDITYEETKSII